MRPGRFLIAAVMAVIAVIGYYASREMNPITGKTQSVGLSQEQEVVLGLQSAPQMAQEFGGPDPDASVQSDLEQIGRKLVRQGKVAHTRRSHALPFSVQGAAQRENGQRLRVARRTGVHHPGVARPARERGATRRRARS